MNQLVRLAPLATLLALAGGSLHAQAAPRGGTPSAAPWPALHWRMIGPFRGGRTVAIAGVSLQPGTYYMAPNNGGVWKSTDYGHTWTPIFDGQPTGSIGALAVAPSDPNVIYVGSGEGLQRPDLSVGDGIYKSTDAGRTWTHLGLSDGQQIAGIVVDPRDPNRLFVAVLGHPYGPNDERGVFRSTDGGASFQKVLYTDANTGASAVALAPDDPNTVYAVLWSARQGPWEYENAYVGPGSGLFRSTDGGATWRRVEGGLPTTVQGLGRIGIAVAPSDARRLYALAQAPDSVGGLYRSDDAGASWRRVNHAERLYGRGDDFAEVRVDPRDPNLVYVANTSTYRSTDGGEHFTAFKGAPGGDDYHSIWIDPRNPRIIFLGVDQGATLSVNGGETWSSWYNQPTAQMFHVTADDRFPYRVCGGQQESGSACVLSRGNDGAITFRDWRPVGVPEYGYAAPDPLHPGIVYGAGGGSGQVTRWDERTGSTQSVGPQATGRAHRFDRTTPILFSPADPRVLLFAGEVLWKTTDGGHTWTPISPDLTRARPGKPPTLAPLADADTVNHRGVIYSIAASPLDAALIWVGTDDGLLHVTRDGGAHWTNITPPELTSWSKVTQLDASHFDRRTAYASVSRFRVDDLHPYIYRTHDGGKTWTKIVAGLPDDAPVNAVREDPARRGLLYAATEHGVAVSLDDGDHWQPLQLDLPVTSVRDIIVKGNDLAIATHGRSFWILDDVTPLRQLRPGLDSEAAHLFAPAPAYRIRRNQNTDTPLPPEEPAGENPPDGAIIDYWIGPSSRGPVVLEIVDARGALVRRWRSDSVPAPYDPTEYPIPAYWMREPRTVSAVAGAHRFVWDLRWPDPDALEHEFPISAIIHDTPRGPQGPMALPGAYTVRLTANGRALTAPLVVKMDPRVTTPPAGIAREFAMAHAIARAIDEDYAALAAVRAARQAHAAGVHGAELASLETGDRAAKLDGLAPLNQRLVSLLDAVDGADATPTAAQEAAWTELRASLDRTLARWREVKGRM